jgi:hypothetical protein
MRLKPSERRSEDQQPQMIQVPPATQPAAALVTLGLSEEALFENPYSHCGPSQR